jgi:hypothetical protein
LALYSILSSHAWKASREKMIKKSGQCFMQASALPLLIHVEKQKVPSLVLTLMNVPDEVFI